MTAGGVTPVDRAALAGDLGRGGYLRGSFAYADGNARHWFQTELVLARPGVLDRCAELLRAHVDPTADRLAARGPAAVAVATALALRTDLTLLLEPEGQTGFAGDVFPGARVILVEDVIMTGRHALASITALRNGSMEVLRTLAVVDREAGGAFAVEAAGVPVTALFTERELLP